jgi:hypothetical protein
MALSNIFREPRREITETVVGVALITIPVVADYFAALELQKLSGGWSEFPWPIGMLFVPLIVILGAMAVAAVAFGLPLVVHAIGEIGCEALEERGIHLRPRNRVRR